jgi:maltose O-acetyltransferase
MKSSDLKVYYTYSYINNLFNLILDLLPPFFRFFFLKFMLAKLGKNVLIDFKVYFRYLNKIHIGNNVEINRGCQFFPSYKIKDAQIHIKNNVVIAPNVIFFGAGQNPDNVVDDVARNIIINDSVYIGGGSIIRYGVEIGNNSIIGAGSVVVGNVPPNCLYAGNPAKLIRNLN